MKARGRLLATQLTLTGLLALSGFPAQAGSVLFSVDGATFQMEVESVVERRFGTVLQQQYDYSCGSAALATLLRHHYGYEVDLDTVFSSMYENGDQAQINRLGFSMLDMKNFLTARGFNAEGVELPLDRYLEMAAVPAIVMIETDGYKHFVVLKGVRQGKVLLGDPALGLKTLSIADFEKSWSGLFFLITSEASTGRQAFNRDSDWELVASAPVDTVTDALKLGEFTLSLPFRGDFY